METKMEKAEHVSKLTPRRILIEKSRQEVSSLIPTKYRYSNAPNEELFAVTISSVSADGKAEAVQVEYSDRVYSGHRWEFRGHTTLKPYRVSHIDKDIRFNSLEKAVKYALKKLDEKVFRANAQIKKVSNVQLVCTELGFEYLTYTDYIHKKFNEESSVQTEPVLNNKGEVTNFRHITLQMYLSKEKLQKLVKFIKGELL